MKKIIFLVLYFFLLSNAYSNSRAKITEIAVAPENIVFSQAFRLNKSYRFNWKKEKLYITSGTLIVIKADKKLTGVSNAISPVLYAGNSTVQRVNYGIKSGHIVGIIPGKIDLTKEIVWFGSPNLPENITKTMIFKQKNIAIKSGIKPISIKKLKSITRDKILVVDSAHQLYSEHISKLVNTYSPAEKKLASSWKLPIVKAKHTGTRNQSK